MKELRFRAWDGKKMIDDVIPVSETSILELFEYEWQETEVEAVEQYTGLKDKNGKEIFEGDIVKARWFRTKNARFDTSGEVKFNDGWFYIYDDPDAQDRLGVPIHNCYDIEVIGNVHQNADLLEDKE